VWSIEWCHFQRPRMIPNADFKGMLNIGRRISQKWYDIHTRLLQNKVMLWLIELCRKKRKTPKTYLPVTSLQPRGYIAEWLRYFLVIVEGPVGCFPTVEFSCDFWQGSWGSPNLAQIFAYGKWLYPYRSPPKMSENVQFWGWIYFLTKYLRPYPQNQPKATFWGTSRCKT